MYPVDPGADCIVEKFNLIVFTHGNLPTNIRRPSTPDDKFYQCVRDLRTSPNQLTPHAEEVHKIQMRWASLAICMIMAAGESVWHRMRWEHPLEHIGVVVDGKVVYCHEISPAVIQD